MPRRQQAMPADEAPRTISPILDQASFDVEDAWASSARLTEQVAIAKAEWEDAKSLTSHRKKRYDQLMEALVEHINERECRRRDALRANEQPSLEEEGDDAPA